MTSYRLSPMSILCDILSCGLVCVYISIHVFFVSCTTVELTVPKVTPSSHM